MNETSIRYHIKTIAQAIIELKHTNERLAFLENELHFLREQYATQERRLRLEICALLVDAGEADFYENYGFDSAYDYTSPISTSYIGNGHQEIVSNTPTAPYVKTVEEIIREVQEMIIELQIKGSVREHRNGLLKFTSTVFGCVYGRTKEEIEKQLKEKIKQFKNKPQKDKTKKEKSPLLSEYYRDEYIPYKKHQNLKSGSLDEIDGMFRFIMAQKFDKRLTEYKSKMIEDFLYSVPKTRKRQKLQGLFNNMFTRAVALSLVKVNPCAPIEKMQHKIDQGKAFSFDEQEEFFQLLFENTELDYMQKCYFTFMYLTGTRRNEALSVRAEDVDFKNKILSIRGTKTEGSNRQIPLTPLVEKLLLSLKPKRGNYFPMSENTVNHIFRKVWEKKKKHKPHDLRHTFGTIQICVEKVDIKTVSLWMGHSTINTTVNIYTHPEQLGKGTFLRGDLSSDEKTAVYRKKYGGILLLIGKFLG